MAFSLLCCQWSNIGMALGGPLMLGAIGGGVQLLRSSGWVDEEFAEQFRQFAVSAGIGCAVQFAKRSCLMCHADVLQCLHE